MGQQRYYITTSIPYVNARPHLGFALEAVQADVLARYHRQRGDDTWFLTGTDDNALKNVRTAEAAGIPVRKLVERNSAAFRALREPLDLSYDDFIQTSCDPRHKSGVERLWRAIDRAGDIDKRAYRGLYCVRCELFYAEDELVDGRCPVHGVTPELVEEENYFFRLSRYGDALLELIEQDRLRVVPGHRRNEVLSFIRRGLDDFSISRTATRARGWGIPVPDDASQVMYVWFDALGNYITALDYATDGERYRRLWLENPQRVHVIGKDILRFHAVYWPAMLLSAGEPLPTTIYVHEFLNIDGERMSKSRGTGADPVALVAAYGTDALRYWLLREVTRAEDTDFTIERLVRRANDDLANDLGNLLQRTLSMLHRYCDGIVPTFGTVKSLDDELAAIARVVPQQIAAALDAFDFRAALVAIWRLVTRANQYVDETTPWVLARQARQGDEAAQRRLETVLYNLAESLRLLAYHLAPFIPETAERIARQLGVSIDEPDAWRWGHLAPGTHVAEPRPLFQKIMTREEPGAEPAPGRLGGELARFGHS